jgi:hypothetical protein
MHKTTNFLLMAAMVGTIALVVLPAAEAQTQPTIAFDSFKSPDAQIKPEIGSGQVTFKVTYTLANPALIPSGVASSTAVVTLTPHCDNPNVFIQGSQTILIPVSPASGQAGTGVYTSPQASFSVTLNRLAPGLQLLQCNMKAKAGPLVQTAVPESNEINNPFQVKAGYFPYISAKVSSATLDASPQKPIPFAIVVDNFGNAQTQVVFAMTGTPNAKWQNVIVPPPLTLDSPNGGGAKTEDTATFTVNTPYKNGWNNEEQSYQLSLQPVAALDNSQTGTPISVSMFARSRGIYIPGPEPALMLAAVLGAALIARLAKTDADE